MTKELTPLEERERDRAARRWREFPKSSLMKRKSPFNSKLEIRELASDAERWLGILDEENDLWAHGSDVFSVWVKKAKAGDRNAAHNLLINLQYALESRDVIVPALAKWVAACLHKTLENGINMATAFSISQEGTGASNCPEYKFKKTRAIEIWREVEIIRFKTGKGKTLAIMQFANCSESKLKASSLGKDYGAGRQLIEQYLTNIQKPEKKPPL